MPRNGENVAGQPLHFLAGQPVASQVTLHAANKNSNRVELAVSVPNFYYFYAPEAHIIYLTVSYSFLISFVKGGGGGWSGPSRVGWALEFSSFFGPTLSHLPSKWILCTHPKHYARGCINLKCINSYFMETFPDSQSGSGTRRAKLTHKHRKKLINFMFWSAGGSLLRAKGVSGSLDVLYGMPRFK
jgi:hypothetical protein